VRVRHTFRGDFSVVIPARDEAPNVAALFAALRATFDRLSLDGEIVLVDDGSADDTETLARREAARFGGRVRVLRHAERRGKTEAIVTGAAAATGAALVLFDADLQYDPDDIPRLLDALDDGWDVVTARKVGRYEKRRVSAAYNWLSRRLFGLRVRDLNSMKALRRDVLAAVTLRHDWHRYLVALAAARGYAITERDVAIRPRRAGRSKYTGARRVAASALDMLRVWLYLRGAA
jgi:glycosyltransferase involved in cell wall biosynthesis